MNNGGTLLLSNGAATDRVNNTAALYLGTGGAGSGSVGGTIAMDHTGAATILEGTGAVNNAGMVAGTSTVGLGVLTLASDSTLDFGTAGWARLSLAVSIRRVHSC